MKKLPIIQKEMNREKKLGNINGFSGGNYAGNVYDKGFLAPALNTCGGQREPMITEKPMITEIDLKENKGYRIRKLTPIECFRLMGFKKSDADKASAVNVSNSQLYRQAGNGIVTNCVKLLFEHLYKTQYDEEYECYDENFT